MSAGIALWNSLPRPVLDAELVQRKLNMFVEKYMYYQGKFSKNSCGSESPGLNLFHVREIMKRGSTDACSVPIPTQGACLHCGQDSSGLHGACKGSLNKSTGKSQMHANKAYIAKISC